MSDAANQRPVVVAVINLKGRVGETTIAALLRRYAVALRLKVLAVDLDPQANLSQPYMGTRYRECLRLSHPSIVEVFSAMHPPGPRKAGLTKLNIQDAVVAISRIPKSAASLDLIPSRFDFSSHLTDSLKSHAGALAQCIADHFHDKDPILIDCAPTESVFTMAAYHASRFVLVPVRSEFFATIRYPLLRLSLDTFRQKNSGQQALREMDEEAKENGWKLADSSDTEAPRRTRRNGRGPGQRRRSVVDYVHAMEVSAERVAVVRRAAEEFARRPFLPRLGDVRGFCGAYGIEESKSRASGIPRTFKFRVTMAVAEVEKMLNARLFSGPAQLVPIADAIRDTAKEYREKMQAGSKETSH